jgi:hypothetical protein
MRTHAHARTPRLRACHAHVQPERVERREARALAEDEAEAREVRVGGAATSRAAAARRALGALGLLQPLAVEVQRVAAQEKGQRGVRGDAAAARGRAVVAGARVRAVEHGGGARKLAAVKHRLGQHKGRVRLGGGVGGVGRRARARRRRRALRRQRHGRGRGARGRAAQQLRHPAARRVQPAARQHARGHAQLALHGWHVRHGARRRRGGHLRNGTAARATALQRSVDQARSKRGMPEERQENRAQSE